MTEPKKHSSKAAAAASSKSSAAPRPWPPVSDPPPYAREAAEDQNLTSERNDVYIDTNTNKYKLDEDFALPDIDGSIRQFFLSLSGTEYRIAEQAILKTSLREKFIEMVGVSETDKESGSLPTKAPALWAERKTGREVSPVDFIHQHYGPWLGKGLTRAHIGQLDKPLYTALAGWVGRNGWPEGLNLPTQRELTDQLLAEMGPVGAPNRSVPAADLNPAKLLQQRIYDAQRYRIRPR